MTLPLDPLFEQAYRPLYDALFSQLQSAASARGPLMGQYNLDLSRLATDQGIAQRQLGGSMAGRGLYNSGVRTTNLNRLNMGYGRQRDDETIAMQKALGALQQQKADAWTQFRQGLGEAYNQSALRSEQDQYAPLPKYGPKNPPPKLPKVPKKPKPPNRKG